MESHLGSASSKPTSPTRHTARADRNVKRDFSGVEVLEGRVLLSSWYVSAGAPASNKGTLASPFPTIQDAANVAGPGDIVYIETGTYHETVSPKHSGELGAPIIYQPYNNESVTIDGADPVATWTNFIGDAFSATQSWDLGEGYNQVFVNGQMMNEARWPNSSLNVSTPTWAAATKVALGASSGGMSTVTLYNAGLTMASGSLVGAIAHFAAGQEWVDQTALVIGNSPTTKSGPGSITISYVQETSYQVPSAGTPFYVVGALSLLDSPGEWYRNPLTKKLYLWDTASNAPTPDLVEAKARNYGFDLSNLSFINVEHIQFEACTVNTNSSSTHNLLDYITASYISQAIGLGSDQQDPWSAQYHAHTTGIILNGVGNTLLNSTIAYSSGDGVFLGGSGNTVENCVIHDVDYEAGDEAAITTLGADEQVLHNTIYYAGRSGIVIRHTTDSLVSYNVVHNVGLQMTDLGGIYTWGTDGEGTEISYNVVYNVTTGGYGAAGVYLDNSSESYIVDHNITWNCNFGLKMNPSCPDDLIVNNTFTGTQYSLESSGNEDMSGSKFYNNIFTLTAQIGSNASKVTNIYSTTNPRFVNAAADNFQLLATSPAINAGTVVSPYTLGYTGSRPDIGAYEYGVTGFAAGAPGALFVPPAPSSGGGTPTSSLTFSAQSANAKWAASNSGSGITYTAQWGWAEYENINFGSGVTHLKITVTSLPKTAIRLQLRVGDAGAPSIATIAIPAGTQPSSVSDTFTATFNLLNGVHNIFLILIDPPAGGTISTVSFS